MYKEVQPCASLKTGVTSNKGLIRNDAHRYIPCMNDPKRGAAFTDGVETQPLLFVV